jgi:hypothetical protein
METSIINLKNYIKELNKEQKADKLQRKTVHLPENFVRTKEPWDAADDVLSRREKLRMLYKIYEIWREKEDRTGDPNFQTWLAEEWGRKKRYDKLFEDVWERFMKNSKPEA